MFCCHLLYHPPKKPQQSNFLAESTERKSALAGLGSWSVATKWSGLEHILFCSMLQHGVWGGRTLGKMISMGALSSDSCSSVT